MLEHPPEGSCNIQLLLQSLDEAPRGTLGFCNPEYTNSSFHTLVMGQWAWRLGITVSVFVKLDVDCSSKFNFSLAIIRYKWQQGWSVWLQHPLPYSYWKITLLSAEAGKFKEIWIQMGICLGKQSGADDCELYISELYVPIELLFFLLL